MLPFDFNTFQLLVTNTLSLLIAIMAALLDLSCNIAKTLRANSALNFTL